jgi:hypothetical protein
MTQTLELTPSELALIENARKQELLAQEAKALKNAARIEEDIRIANQQIEKELGWCRAQLEATEKYYRELVKLNPEYNVIVTPTINSKVIKDPGTFELRYSDKKTIKEIEYTTTKAHIELGKYKITISQDSGYKMYLTGPHIPYNNRGLKVSKTVNDKINSALESIKRDIEAKAKKLNAVDTCYNTLSELYPNATIEKGTEWMRNTWSKNISGENIDTIKIKLENGITVKYRIYMDGTMGRLETTFPTKSSLEVLEALSKCVFTEA